MRINSNGLISHGGGGRFERMFFHFFFILHNFFFNFKHFLYSLNHKMPQWLKLTNLKQDVFRAVFKINLLVFVDSLSYLSRGEQFKVVIINLLNNGPFISILHSWVNAAADTNWILARLGYSGGQQTIYIHFSLSLLKKKIREEGRGREAVQFWWQ
jgi:hypothetical protein